MSWNRQKQFILWSTATSVVAVVVLVAVLSPHISRNVLKSVREVPGVSADRAQVDPFGVRIEGMSFRNDLSGVTGRVREVHAGWLTVVGLQHRLKLQGGGVVLPSFTALFTKAGAGVSRLAVEFESMEAVMPLKGRHLVLGGMTGSAVIRDGLLTEVDVEVERIGGVEGGIRFKYVREQSNSVELRVNLAGLEALVGPGTLRAEGVVEFSGNMDPETFESSGSLRARGVALETPFVRISGLRVAAEASFSLHASELDISVETGILKTRDILHDFGVQPAHLLLSGAEKDGVIKVDKLELKAPGWVNMNLAGTVDAAGRVDIEAQLTDVPMKPLIKSRAIEVTAPGKASRSYHIKGVWPRLSCQAVSAAEGVTLFLPRVDLEIRDIRTGQLEGEWQLEKADEWQQE